MSDRSTPRGSAGLCLLALLGSQLLFIHLFQAELARILVLKPEYIYLRILPGLVWPLGGAWLAAAWFARRRPGFTAVPLGFSLTSSIWLSVGVLLPIFQQGRAQGLNLEQASTLAWSAGVGLTALAGVIQLLLSSWVTIWLRAWSGAVCSGVSAALALTAIGACTPSLLEHPLLLLAGVVTLVAFLQVGLPRPFGLPVAWLGLGLGLAMQLVSGTFFEVPELGGSLLPNWEADWIRQGWEFLWVRPEFVSAALPLVLFSVARDLSLLGEVEKSGQTGSIRSTLATLGCCNLLGALLGCGLPLGVLPGFSGFQRWRGGQVYAQAAGLLLLSFGLLGGFALAIRWMPLPTLGVFWVALLLLSAAHSIERASASDIPEPPGGAATSPRTPAFRGLVLAATTLPFLSLFQPGASGLLTALIWGGIASALQRSHYTSAALVALTGCLLNSLGFVHGAEVGIDFDGISGVYLVAALFFQVAQVIRPETPAPESIGLSEADEELLSSLAAGAGIPPSAIVTDSGRVTTPEP